MLRDHGLIVRTIPYRDHSLIYHLLTAHHGRIALLARGVRNSKRYLQAELAPLHRLDVQWQAGRGELAYLHDAERLDALVPEPYLLAGQTVLATAARLFQHGHDEHGYDDLCDAMASLSGRADETTGLAVAQWQLLVQGGWVGDLLSCWQCQQRFDDHRQPRWLQGSLRCSHCSHGTPLELDALKHCVLAWHHPDYVLSAEYQHLWLKMTRSLLANLRSSS